MELLAQYGIFLLKTFTLVIAFLLLLGGVLAIARKPKNEIEITPLHKHYQDIQQRMLKAIAGKTKKVKLSKAQKKAETNKPSLFVIDFEGDMKASQVEQLRQEVSAVLAVATSQDEIVVRIDSPGGTVNGYGLAATQLQRIRDKGIKLTASIDKVAASGGYLMACVANQIIAAPFAIIGSIGVVAQLPNFHRLLKKNNIDVELLTAGEYKRTVTMFAENTQKGREKFLAELNKIHDNFKTYVLQNRTNLDIDQVATGEHWLAKDALNLHLVDDLKSSDEYIIDKLGAYNIFKITVPGKQPWLAKLLNPAMRYIYSLVIPFNTKSNV